MHTPKRNRPIVRVLALACGVVVMGTAASVTPAAVDPQLAALVASKDRDPAFVTRDAARHPVEELSFFGLRPDMTVVELWPGGGYWTEILGPYLAKSGHYYAALPLAKDKEESEGVKKWRARIAAHKERIGPVKETLLGPGHYDIAPPGSADLVVTFRNLHNWVGDGIAGDVLAGCFRALKPGGILGIEDHRVEPALGEIRVLGIQLERERQGPVSLPSRLSALRDSSSRFCLSG